MTDESSDVSHDFDALDALRALDEGLLCVSAAWRVTFANAAWSAGAGRAPEDYVGADFWDALPGLVGTEAEALVRATMRDGRPRSFRVAYRDDRVDETFHVRVRRAASRALVLTARPARPLGDRSAEHARLVQEARAASEMRNNFVATVSHELRTPLTALTGYGELLADEIVGPLTADQRDAVDRMRLVTHQLTAMIEEILTFSSLEAGRELVRPRPVDAEDPVQAAATVIAPLASQKGLSFSCDVAPDVPRLVTDPDKVRQILVNLAANAVKFTERGAVRIEARRDAGPNGAGDVVRFAVSDTGLGIAADDVGRLFQAFTQLHTGLTRRYGGTGLGLYIARRLAELLGGRVEVASELGRGSVFSLVVPVEVRR